MNQPPDLSEVEWMNEHYPDVEPADWQDWRIQATTQGAHVTEPRAQPPST